MQRVRPYQMEHIQNGLSRWLVVTLPTGVGWDAAKVKVGEGAEQAALEGPRFRKVHACQSKNTLMGVTETRRMA